MIDKFEQAPVPTTEYLVAKSSWVEVKGSLTITAPATIAGNAILLH